MQRLTAQGNTTWKVLFRSVCCNAPRKLGVHFSLHLWIDGELPRRRFSRPI